jgi:anhydro-N-acetylmuramic acid kinase
VIVAGVMSGTSLDGIDVAIVDLKRSGGRLAIKLLAFHSAPYPKAVREALLSISNAMTHTATIARLHFLLGELYAEAIRKSAGRRKLDLIGMHGQTIFHEGAPVEYLGRRVASTFQIGEAAVVAERTGVRTISNFRERDIAAGGQGAPLVPLVDHILFRSRRVDRVALNIGGIANLTFIPRNATPDQVIAFDTGPGNMVIDALVRHLTDGQQQYDRNGSIARRGAVHERLLASMMSDPFIVRKPPKTTGRERFGADFANGLIASGVALPDLISTATEFTAWSIARGVRDATNAHLEVIVSGGGLRNRFLMRRLAHYLKPHPISSSAEYGIDPDAKEAIAFAVLAHESAHGRPCNVPSATGARRELVLGKSTPA